MNLTLKKWSLTLTIKVILAGKKKVCTFNKDFATHNKLSCKVSGFQRDGLSIETAVIAKYTEDEWIRNKYRESKLQLQMPAEGMLNLVGSNVLHISNINMNLRYVNHKLINYNYEKCTKVTPTHHPYFWNVIGWEFAGHCDHLYGYQFHGY